MCGLQQTGKFLKRLGIPQTLTCIQVSWEACMQVKKQQLNQTMDWFKIGKGIYQGCILSPCLFHLYAEYMMENARLDESQTGIKIAGKYQ